MASWKVAPALAAGNCCILKPSELASVTCLELAAIAHEVGVIPARWGDKYMLCGAGSHCGGDPRKEEQMHMHMHWLTSGSYCAGVAKLAFSSAAGQMTFHPATMPLT